MPAYASEVANSGSVSVLQWWYERRWLKRSNAVFLKYANGEVLRRKKLTFVSSV
jgi:hypothetical protein